MRACVFSREAHALSQARSNFETAAAELDIGGSGHFQVPELCRVAAIIFVVLVAQLLAIVLLLAGDDLSWKRFSLLSLFVQWVALTSAGLLCAARSLFARLPLLRGAGLAFSLVMAVTLMVGLISDRVLHGTLFGEPLDWQLLARQLAVAGIIAFMVLRYFHVQQRLRVQEQSELKSRIQALQSRIRPHFLFNSMNIIASLIAVDPDTAETVVEDLSELFRASLNEAGNQVKLSEELALCERYTRIEGLRLGDRLRMDWQVEAVPEAVRIPLLTLQPLLENAIYHGIQPLPEGGCIEVQIGYANDQVDVRISNPLPGPGYPVASEGNRMALANIRSRLEVLYGAAANLEAAPQGDRFVTTLSYPYTADAA